MATVNLSMVAIWGGRNMFWGGKIFGLIDKCLNLSKQTFQVLQRSSANALLLREGAAAGAWAEEHEITFWFAK